MLKKTFLRFFYFDHVFKVFQRLLFSERFLFFEKRWQS